MDLLITNQFLRSGVLRGGDFSCGRGPCCVRGFHSCRSFGAVLKQAAYVVLLILLAEPTWPEGVASHSAVLQLLSGERGGLRLIQQPY